MDCSIFFKKKKGKILFFFSCDFHLLWVNIEGYTDFNTDNVKHTDFNQVSNKVY